MSTSYKAWLQNNGFVQSFENQNVFELKNTTDTKTLAKAKEKAKELKVAIVFDSTPDAPSITIL
jgi:hypothetical protein